MRGSLPPQHRHRRVPCGALYGLEAFIRNEPGGRLDPDRRAVRERELPSDVPGPAGPNHECIDTTGCTPSIYGSAGTPRAIADADHTVMALALALQEPRGRDVTGMATAVNPFK